MTDAATLEATPATTALLPTRTRMNPTSPEGAEFYDENQVGYVLRGGVEGQDRYVLATSAGKLGSDWETGTVHDLRHDQTGAKFGVFTVIGRKHFDTGWTTGEVPDRRLVHYVVK